MGFCMTEGKPCKARQFHHISDQEAAEVNLRVSSDVEPPAPQVKSVKRGPNDFIFTSTRIHVHSSAVARTHRGIVPDTGNKRYTSTHCQVAMRLRRFSTPSGVFGGKYSNENQPGGTSILELRFGCRGMSCCYLLQMWCGPPEGWHHHTSRHSCKLLPSPPDRKSCGRRDTSAPWLSTTRRTVMEPAVWKSSLALWRVASCCLPRSRRDCMRRVDSTTTVWGQIAE